MEGRRHVGYFQVKVVGPVGMPFDGMRRHVRGHESRPSVLEIIQVKDMILFGGSIKTLQGMSCISLEEAF